MDNRLNIPKTLKVGFQDRSDTYTGKLAYVVYINAKNQIAKEKSWEGWRDKKIDVVECPNEPISGFVLNKQVGGGRGSYDWHARREKVRVFDPRNFEFEISTDNLLFILQECSSIKGKGLEGEFVYAWSGPELVLLPVDSQEYEASTNFCNLQKEKLSKEDIQVGCTYLTKDQQEVMYLGRHTWYERKQVERAISEEQARKYMGYYCRSTNVYDTVIEGKKRHIFVHMKYVNGEKLKPDYDGVANKRAKYWLQDGFTKVAKRISDKPIHQYAEEFEALEKTGYTSKPVELVMKEGVKKKDLECYWRRGLVIRVGKKHYFVRHNEMSRSWEERQKNPDKPDRFELQSNTEAVFEDGIYKELDRTYDIVAYKKQNVTMEEIQTVCGKLYLKCENGVTYQVGE